MTIIRTSKQIRNFTASLQKDLDERLKALRAKRDVAQANAEKYQISDFPKQVERLDKEIAGLQATYKTSFERQNVALQDALAHEEQQAQQAAAIQQGKEDHLKAMALNSWTRAGGNPDEFEGQWPELLKTQLQGVVLQDLQSKQLNSSAVHL